MSFKNVCFSGQNIINNGLSNLITRIVTLYGQCLYGIFSNGYLIYNSLKCV